VIVGPPANRHAVNNSAKSTPDQAEPESFSELLTALLRQAGLAVTTLREHYGQPQDQRISNEEWIELTAERGWVSLHKDAAIRRNLLERQTVRMYSGKSCAALCRVVGL